jgi:hypothetical protein
MSVGMSEYFGGTKKKLKASTFSSAARIAGPRPHCTPASTTVSM